MVCLYLTGFGGRPDEGRQKVGARKDSPRWFPRYLEYMIVSNSSALFYESVLYVPQGIDSKGDGIVHNTNGVV
jgi:hypothetical protein